MEAEENNFFAQTESSVGVKALEMDEKAGDSKTESEDNLKCHLCNELYTDPRVLPCLHVFCTSCIMRLMSSGLNEELGGVLECPVCHQRDALPDGGNVSCLPLDIVMLNARDIADVRRGNVVCTGCMSHRNAVAHCVDCCAFLCPSCVSAHRLMHCFESHQVSFSFCIAILLCFSNLNHSVVSLVEIEVC